MSNPVTNPYGYLCYEGPDAITEFSLSDLETLFAETQDPQSSSQQQEHQQEEIPVAGDGLIPDISVGDQPAISEPQQHEENQQQEIPEIRPLEIPASFASKIDKMRGTGARLVIEKFLTPSDVNGKLGRMSIPCTPTREKEFLQNEEISLLKREANGKPAVMHVKIIDPRLKVLPIALKKWNMGSRRANSPSYVLTKSWNDLVKENELRERDCIQLWSFRDPQEQLRFALVLVPRAV